MGKDTNWAAKLQVAQKYIKLQKALEDDIIDSETTQELMRLHRNQILKEYPPKQCKDGSWYVNIRFQPGPNGRKTIKKKDRKEVEDELIKFISNNTTLSTLMAKKEISFYPYYKAFDRWIKAQHYINMTEDVNRRAYRRYFEKLDIGRDIAQKDIRSILPGDIEEHMVAAVKEYNISTKKANEMYHMFYEAVFAQAVADRIIDALEKPEYYVQKNRFLKYCRTGTITSDQDRIIHKDAEEIIRRAIATDHEKKKDYMPAYASELSYLTAMRCGELAGLTWDMVDLETGVIYISQSKKYDPKKKAYYMSTTKNGKYRAVPITEDIANVLNAIKDVQNVYGQTGNFVFSTNKGAITNRQVSDYLYNKKKQYHIDQPVSIHAQRRTLNSKMEAAGVPVAIRASMLGHTRDVNQSHYTYDVTDIGYKKQVLANVQH